MSATPDVTELLVSARSGHAAAVDAVVPLVYEELRRIAARQLQGERAEHTLSATALVHEAYLKLVNLDRMDWKSRAQFFAIAAQAMRRTLVNHALAKKRQKRGGAAIHVTLDGNEPAAPGQAEEVLALHQAIERLDTLEPRHGRIVELRFFGGLSIEETAQALDVSPATVKRDWTLLRAWLKRELGISP
jgi:RNA polymerase sigma factor (TIGR02999 family)